MDAKQLACVHSSLIIANNFAPVSEALGTQGSMVKINWSVWEKSNKVEWTFSNQNIVLEFSKPPLSVTPFKVNKLIAIVGNSEEFGSENLIFFDESGTLIKKLVAPELGENSHFGSATELDKENIRAKIGYFELGVFQEQQCTINFSSGAASSFCRGGF